MIFDFLEVGSSDFDHEIGQGVLIEPVTFYFDRIALRDGCKKYNYAISDDNGICDVYYAEEEDIKKYLLPWWFRGCSSINKHHPQVSDILLGRGIDRESLIKKQSVKKYTLNSFLVRENIRANFFKIDTEGHDCIILNKFVDECTDENLFPQKIMFESNFLIDNNEIQNTINKLEAKSYRLSHRGESNTFLTRV
jgi:hypothetical protein